MKNLFLLSAAALIMTACSTTHSSDKMMGDDMEKMATEESMDMKKDDMMHEGDKMHDDAMDMKEDAMDMKEDAMDMKEDAMDMKEDAMDMKEDAMMEKEDSMMEPAPAPAASVDCTGLSDDECMAKVMNFGNEPMMEEEGGS